MKHEARNARLPIPARSGVSSSDRKETAPHSKRDREDRPISNGHLIVPDPNPCELRPRRFG